MKNDFNPNKIPWNSIQTLMSSCIYGGRIENEFDQKILITFVKKLFNETCFNNDFKLISDNHDQIMLDIIKTSKNDYLDWVDKIKLEQKPSWLGLPNNAERILLKNMGTFLFKKY